MYSSTADHPYLSISCAFTIFVIGTVLHRLYLHPLAKFPGPKLAAITYLYEYYFDGIQQGQYTSRIWEMHDKYGPIVRINPDELHCNNPDWIDQIYAAGGKKREKSRFFVSQFNLPGAGFGTLSHDLHRSRRNALNRYFSKAAVAKLEDRIQDKAELLCEKFLEMANTGTPIDLAVAFSCFTTDVVTGDVAPGRRNLQN